MCELCDVVLEQMDSNRVPVEQAPAAAVPQVRLGWFDRAAVGLLVRLGRSVLAVDWLRGRFGWAEDFSRRWRREYREKRLALTVGFFVAGWAFVLVVGPLVVWWLLNILRG